MDSVEDERVDIFMLKCHVLSAASVVWRVLRRLFFAVCLSPGLCLHWRTKKFQRTEPEKADTCQNHRHPFSKKNRGGVFRSQACLCLLKRLHTNCVTWILKQAEAERRLEATIVLEFDRCTAPKHGLIELSSGVFHKGGSEKQGLLRKSRAWMTNR